MPPTSGPANAEPIHHDAAIAVANATVVGAGVGPADIDAVIAAISAEHGDPSADTKWMTASGACQDDADTRVIWWSDLRIVAERGAGTTAIVGWSFGDPQAAPNVASGPGASPPSLGLATDGGVTLGDARDDVRRTLDDGTVTSEDAARIVVTAGPRTLVFLFSADGHLSGIGSEDTTCG